MRRDDGDVGRWSSCPCVASLSRNSTNRFEKDWRQLGMGHGHSSSADGASARNRRARDAAASGRGWGGGKGKEHRDRPPSGRRAVGEQTPACARLPCPPAAPFPAPRRLAPRASILTRLSAGFLLTSFISSWFRPVASFEDDLRRCWGRFAWRWRPAFSRSASSHCRIVESSCSISKRFESARDVVRNDNRTLVTSRRSTLTSEVLFRSRRSASVRCSLFTTAVDVSYGTER